MKSDQLWQLFLETGAPELYLLYNKARKTEDTDVLDNPGGGSARYTL